MERQTKNKITGIATSSEAPREILSSRIEPRSLAVVEPLEPRIVLAVNVGAGVATATALSGAQVNEIIGGLGDIGALGNELEKSGVLAQGIEGLGVSVGELFNFGTSSGKGGFFAAAFRDQLDGLLNDPALQPTGPTVAQINTWLNTSPAAGTTGSYSNVTWSLSQGGEYTGSTHPLEWEVTIGGTRSTENDFVPGQEAEDAGIEFSAAPQVATDASASFKFSFGLTATNQFFATFGDLTFTVAGTQPLAGMTGEIEYTVGGSEYPFTLATGSTVALGASFGNVTITGAGSADGQWTRAELTALAGTFADSDFSVGTTTDNGLQATIRLATAGGTPVQLTFADAAVLDVTAPTFEHNVALVDYVAGGNVTGIFQRIQDIGALLDNNPLRSANLPGIATAFGAIEELPDFSDLLALRDKANDYMTVVANPTVNGLAAELNTFLAAQLDAAGITLDTLALTTEFDPRTSSMLLTFALDTGDISKTFEFDRFGAAATQAGLSFNRDQTLQIGATLRVEGGFGFGFDLTRPAANTRSVFFTSAGIDASLDFDVTNLDLGATLGPVAADIVDGEIHASAGLALSITDATDDGRYTLAELTNGNEVAFGFTTSGTFEAVLPLDIKIAGATFTNPQIRISTPDIFNVAPIVDTGTASFDKIFNLGKVGPDAVLDLIIAVGDWASNFRNAPVFGANIPFLNADLGDAFDFGLLFTKNLRDKLQNDLSYVALKGDFAAFTLAAKAPLVLDGERIELPAGAYSTKDALISALNTALGAGSKFEAQAHGDNGVRIAAKDANETPDFSILGATHQLKTIGFVSSSAVVTSEVTLPLDAPTNGKITADAQFQLSVDGGTPVTVSVAKTATDNNTTVANLAADIDAALASQGVDAVAVGNKVKLVRPDGKSFMVVGVPGTTFQQLGIESASAAGLTDAGSTLQSGLTYQTLTDMVPFLLDELGVGDGDGDPSNDPIRARYDVATETIILHFEHEFVAPTITLPVGINFNLDGWASLRTVDAAGNDASATLTFTPTISGSFDLGISLADDGGFQELAIAAQTGFAPNGYGEKADGSPDSNNALAWDGKLQADAVFKISFEDGVERTLTIAKSATDANTTAAHLLADVKAAIAATVGLAGKIDARLIAKQGGTSDRIEFFTLEQAGDFQIRDLRVRLASASPAETMGFPQDQLELSSAPALAVSNNSQASLDLSPAGDAKFTLSLDGGAPVQLTVTTANMAANTEMSHLLSDINTAIAGTALAGKVKAIRYGLGNQIQFVAAEGTRQMSFSADTAASQTTLNFGTEKIVTRSRGGTFFVDNASLEATGTLALTDLNLAAQLGFIGVSTSGLDGSVQINATVSLEDDAQNTRFEVGELFSRVGDGTICEIVQLDFDGSATATMSGLQVDAGLLSLSANAEVALTATDIFAAGGPNFAVNFNGFDPTKLLNFSNASWRDIYEGIKLGVQVLGQTEQFGFLADTKIPLINLSVAEVFSYSDQLVAAIDQLEANPAGALDEVELRIEELLGIPDENFDLSLEDNSVVKIHLGISTSFSATYGLDFDLAEIAKYTNGAIPADLLSLGGFLDASANGSLQFGAFAGLSLDLGLDFSGGGAPSVLVFSSSGVDLGVRVTGQNLNISASLGPAGFEITDGEVTFDGDGIFDANGDGLQDADFATMHFGPLANITDIPGTISAISGGAPLSSFFGPTFNGVIKATLPGAITSDIGSLDLPGPIVVEVADVTALFSSDPLVRKNAIQLTLPDMSDLLPEVPGLIQLLRDPSILLGGLDGGLGAIQRLLAGKTATKLPLIGDQLRSGSGFIEEFRAGFLGDLTEKLRGAGDRLLDTMQVGMFDLFAADTDGALGLALGILQDYNSDGVVTKDDVVLSFRKADGSIWRDGTDSPQSQEAVQFNLHLGQSITFGTDLDIDWGLPGLELDINGSPQITAGWDLFLGFGVSVNDFFYLDAAPPEEFTGSGATLTAGAAVEHELRLGFEAVLTSDPANPFTATGRLFFLQLDAVDQEVDGEFSHVSGAVYVDLNDPGTGSNADNRTTVKELFSKGAVKPITAGLEAEAIVNLGLTASVEGSTAIPRVLANFHLDWNFELGQAVQTPNVSFEDVRLDLGSFVTDFLKPIVNKVDEIIKPFDPVLDALQTRIPVLSDIMGRNYTVLDLAVQFGKVDRRFVDAVIQVRDLVGDIAALPDGVSIEIPLGDLAGLGGAFSTKNGAKNVDTSSTGTQQIGFGSGLNAQQQQYQNTFNKSTKITGGGFGFPILKPANAFKLLLGQEATLITYDIPRLEVGMSMSRTFPIWGPLVGKFNGSISAYADFAVGFDTKGFNTFRTSGDVVDILDGFYVSDRANADGTGADVYEAGFQGRIGIGGAINAAIIEAGIEGFFQLNADLDLKDPNDDGKIRGSEMIALLTHPNGYGPLNLGSIRLRGDVGARAYVDFWAPFDWYNAWEWEFARVTLFDKTFSAPDVTPDLGTTKTIGGENTLVLNAGPSANQRDFISTSDVGEEFIVTGTGKNVTVTFTNTGHSQSLNGVDRIVFTGGKGNDRIIVGAGVTTAITFDGGEGDDYFEGGAGNDIVIGGVGNDTLIGNGGSNTLDGGDGADTIVGGTGADIIIGGNGDDVLNGGGGADTYKFADNWGKDVFDGDQTGTGAFDFTSVTRDLTLSVSATGAQGSSGNNFISFDSTLPYITSLKGGSGNDVATVSATGAAMVTIDGGIGSDQYLISFGRLETAIFLNDTGAGVGESDTVKIQPLTRDYTISVGDLYVSGVKAGIGEQRANFTNGIENLTVDAKSNGGSIVQIAEPISFVGDVRLLARQALIGNTVDAGNVRVESTLAVNIGANVNAHANGGVTVLVNGGNITVTEDVMSSAGLGFTGDGAGLVHLFTSGGAIVTGQGNGGPGRILAAEGSLLLRGTNGNIGTLDTPIYSTVRTAAASTTGLGIINLHESDGLVVDVIASIEGIKTTGGLLNIFNDSGELRVNAPISLGGGDGTLTSDLLEIDADVTSPGGDIFLRPEGDLTVMSVGNGVTGVFAIDQSEIDHLVNGLASIQIGLPLGRNLVNLGNATFLDPTLLQNPVLGGHINQTGIVNVLDGATFTIFGSGHTTELNNQNVAGNIDIIDSAVVRQGETVTLTSTGGAINMNFALDGTAGGADETLILNALNDVTIKGAIGSAAQLGTLRITGAANVHLEGSVNVKNLILDAGTTLTVDGAVNAQSIALNGVAAVTFHSGITLSTALVVNGSTLNSAIFEGQVSAPSVTVTAKQLVDFYQLVDVTSTLNVTTTNATGDIIFRQQVNAHSGDITVQSLDDITFIGPVAGDDLTVVSADAFALQANVELLGRLLQSAGTGVSTFAQLTASSASITSAGLILGGITTLTGAPGLVVNVGTGTFSAGNSVSAPSGPLNLTARSISFQGTVAAASATFAATESITVANASSFTLTGALNATTTSAVLGEIKFSGPVEIGTTATLNTPRGLTFQNTLEVNGALTVQAASSAQYQGAVSVGGAFTQQAGVTGATSFTSTLQAGSLSLQAGSFSFGGEVMSGGAAGITANNGGITATADVFVAGALTTSATTNIAFQGATVARSMAFTAAGTVTVGAGGLSTAASPTSGDIQINTTGAVAGNSVTLNGAVNAKGAFGINAARSVLASNTISAASLTASGTALTFNGLIGTTGAAGFNTSGALNLAAGLNAGGALTVGSAASVLFGEAVTAASASITATNTINISVGGLRSNTGAISLTTTAAGAGNSINALGLIDAATALSLNTPRGVALNLVEAGSFTVDAASINLPAAVTTTGAISLTAAASGNITAGATISAGGAFTISRGKAITTSGLVSATAIAIGQGVADSIETVSVGVGGMTATNDLRIRTTVAGAGNGITVQGPLIAGNAATLALDSARGVDVTGSITAGDLVVSGASITLRNAINAGDDVTLSSPGALQVDRDLIVTGDVAVTQAGALTFGARLQAANLSISNAQSAGFTGEVNIAQNATISLSGNMTAASTFTVLGALNIPSAAVITLNGAVSAGNAAIAGAALVTGSDFTTTTGGFAITTTGDVTIAGKTTVAQTLSVLGSDDVTLSGAVAVRNLTLNAASFLAGGALTTNVGDATFTTTGNIRVVGLATIAANLLVTNALNTTFQGQVAVTGSLTQQNGGGTTRFEGVTGASSINIRSAQQIFAGSTFRANSGDIRLESDEIDFFGGTNAVQGAQSLILRPYLANTSIDVGSPTPTGVLDFSDVDINALQDGFAQIVIGRAEDGTGAMLIGSSSFKDNVAFYAGSIMVESNTLVGQVVTTLESIEMTARTGSIVANDDLFGTDANFRARDNITINNKIEVADFIILTAGTDGSGSINHNGALTTTALNGTVDLTAGANSGSITITSTIATFAADLTAGNGAITQTAGNTKASELNALALSGITLLTTADHISARVTGTGDIFISDTNPSAAHFLDLGSKTDVNDGLFTADGDITVIADQNANAFRIEANGAVMIETGGEVYVDRVSGAPVSVTGTILIDEDRTTNGEEIRFDGNIRLLRDITLTSNGGDLIITGRINSTPGQHFGLTLDAGGGNVTVGGQIGNVTPLEFLQINGAAALSLGGGVRTEGDIEINADSIAITAPKGSIATVAGGDLRLLPNSSSATIDIGGPNGGSAQFSLDDAEIAALGNGFGSIQIGQRGGTHDVQIESARFLDDLEINGDSVTLLKSSRAQSVNGLSAVNGQDDNDITINAQSAFVQGRRAALAAGRNGNITITADTIELDAKSRGLVRGFGELLLQPLSVAQAITLGGAGAGFELTKGEFGALGDTFKQLTIGRADGAHAINISASLSLRDNTLIRAPHAGGSVTIGSGLAPMTLQTVGRADSLRIESAGGITVDANVKTAGRGALELLADFDVNGDGDVLVGQNLGKPNKSVSIASEHGAIRLQGENVTLGIDIPTQKDAGIVKLASIGGDIGIRTNIDGDADGGFTFRHLKSSIATAGLVKIESANHGGTADLGGGAITGKRGVEISGFESVTTNATKVKSDVLIAIEAINATLKSKTALTSLAAAQIIGDPAAGVITLEAGANISAVRSILLDAADVQRAPLAALKTKALTINEL